MEMDLGPEDHLVGVRWLQRVLLIHSAGKFIAFVPTMIYNTDKEKSYKLEKRG